MCDPEQDEPPGCICGRVGLCPECCCVHRAHVVDETCPLCNHKGVR